MVCNQVSILVLVDVVSKSGVGSLYSRVGWYVSILVLVDVVSKSDAVSITPLITSSFNPCFSGCCFQIYIGGLSLYDVSQFQSLF